MKITNPNTGRKSNIIYTSDLKVEQKIGALIKNNNWEKFSLKKRMHYMKRFQNILKRNSNLISDQISKETGKPRWESLSEVEASISKVNTTFTAIQYRLNYPTKNNIMTTIKPIGLIGVIGPFNFPLHIPNGQIIPALLTGNTVIVKSSEYTQKTTKIIESIWRETFNNCPCPIQFVYGEKSVGEKIVNHKEIDAIFFTGSSTTGRKIEQKCLSLNKLCVLEMGGNNAMIIEDDFNTITSNIIGSSFITAGQRCSCSRRIIINKKISHIIPKLIKDIKSININKYPCKNHTFMGPVVLPQIKETILLKEFNHSETLLKSINLSKGGLISPRVELTDINYDEELFGPIIFITLSNSFEESLAIANNTKYGLCTSIYTKERKKFIYGLKESNCGIINWNSPTTGASGLAPFGGVKESGNYRPAGFNMIDHCIIPVGSKLITKPSNIDFRGS
ncbi:MAG: aldehyde dehydrogenase family protein [Candidatus Margulisiibacteriota bacterium]